MKTGSALFEDPDGSPAAVPIAPPSTRKSGAADVPRASQGIVRLDKLLRWLLGLRLRRLSPLKTDRIENYRIPVRVPD